MILKMVNVLCFDTDLEVVIPKELRWVSPKRERERILADFSIQFSMNERLLEVRDWRFNVGKRTGSGLRSASLSKVAADGGGERTVQPSLSSRKDRRTLARTCSIVKKNSYTVSTVRTNTEEG
jgi:hypothetical protein